MTNEQTNRIADALLAIAHSLDSVAHAIHRLGTADAATSMGGLELLAMETKNGFAELAAALDRSRWESGA